MRVKRDNLNGFLIQQERDSKKQKKVRRNEKENTQQKEIQKHMKKRKNKMVENNAT